MKLKNSKSIAIILTLSLILTQFLGLFSVDEVFAEEVNTDYSNIVPGKVLVKYKTQEEENTFGIRSMQMTQINPKQNIKEFVLSEGEDVFDAIDELNNDPNVEYAEPIYIRRALGTFADAPKRMEQTVSQSVYDPNDPYYTDKQWGLSAIKLTDAWEKVSSTEREEIVIAILDTGVDLDHPDLQNSIVPGYDFINDDNDPNDDRRHGTHVAGIAAAIADNGIGIAGTASGVKIMPVKVLNSEGLGTTQNIIDGIYWAVDNGADVINMSLGAPGGSFLEYEAIVYAVNNGVSVIASVGNDSNHWIPEDGEKDIDDPSNPDYAERYESSVSYPAAYPGVIGVGAIDHLSDTDYFLADFSNVGSEVDVVAPGVDIYSTLPDNGYGWASGTSMSAPFVSGLAALLRAANVDLTPEQTFDILVETSKDMVDPLGEVGEDNYYGHGLINGSNAFNIPRLEMELIDEDLMDADEEITVNLATVDYNGSVIDDVYGQALIAVERYDYNDSYYADMNELNTVVDVVYGQGTGVLNLPEPGVYRFHANENDDNNWVWSESGYAVRKPELPTANVNSGTYTSSQSVTLSTNTAGAKIYYTLNGTEPTTDSQLYSSAINISSTKTLKAIAYKNGVASTISTFSYTINTDTGSTGGSSGGGGGGGASAPEQVEDEVTTTEGKDGKTTVTVDVSEDRIEDELDSKDEEVVIEVEDEKAEKIEVNLTGNILNKAVDKNKIITIKSKNVTLNIDPSTLNIESKKAKIKLTASELSTDETEKELSKKSSNAKEVSKVFDFDLSVDNEKVSKFNKSIKITIKFDSKDVKDKNKLGVYYYNEDNEEWEYVGGKVKDASTITFETNHFSKYAVMEYNRTFEDINNHWAKEDIEVMAAKHIANGVTDASFAPERNITRAEFAALLTRALKLDETDSENVFTDVANGTWYQDPVIKAYSAGIITGIDDTTFAPNANITREQMATMIMRAYSNGSGIELDSIVTTAEVKFTDEGAVSSWARRNVRLVEAVNLMNGNSDGTFGPKDNATRAQAISAIKRLMEKLDIM